MRNPACYAPVGGTSGWLAGAVPLLESNPGNPGNPAGILISCIPRFLRGGSPPGIPGDPGIRAPGDPPERPLCRVRAYDEDTKTPLCRGQAFPGFPGFRNIKYQ